jgi:hypothetical protein
MVAAVVISKTCIITFHIFCIREAVRTAMLGVNFTVHYWRYSSLCVTHPHDTCREWVVCDRCTMKHQVSSSLVHALLALVSGSEPAIITFDWEAFCTQHSTHMSLLVA